MSRCKQCNNAFSEDNAWQEFCCLSCARAYFVPRPEIKHNPPNKREEKRIVAYKADLRKFRAQLKDPKFARLVKLDGKKAKAPQPGCNSDIVIRPMTEDDRKLIERQRGRGFGENHVHHVSHDLPSTHQFVGCGWYPHD